MSKNVTIATRKVKGFYYEFNKIYKNAKKHLTFALDKGLFYCQRDKTQYDY